jgi:hypothetical protein
MRPINPDLFNALVAALPFGFLNKLKEAQPNIYQEAFHATHSDPLLESPEAEYLTPHLRRAIFETNFRKSAIDSGLTAAAQYNNRKTAQYTVVRAGNFIVTASYVNERSSRVRNALFRSDLSALNTLLSQMTLQPFDTPEMVGYREGSIYCILLHGPDPLDKTVPGFMQWAVPDQHNHDWVEQFDFADVYQASLNRQAPQQIDLAKPVLKKRKEEGGGNA